jgi:hypothetical protein
MWDRSLGRYACHISEACTAVRNETAHGILSVRPHLQSAVQRPATNVEHSRLSLDSHSP